MLPQMGCSSADYWWKALGGTCNLVLLVLSGVVNCWFGGTYFNFGGWMQAGDCILFQFHVEDGPDNLGESFWALGYV